MAKAKTLKEAVDLAKIQALEEQNKILQQKVADLESSQSRPKSFVEDRLNSEMNKIRAKGQSQANRIKVYENCDYNPVTLYSKDGRVITNLHPDNAIQTLNRFAAIGIALSTDKPTPQEMFDYQNTPEYKAREKKEQEVRARKQKTLRSGQFDKLSEQIAKLAGVKIEEINAIRAMNEVVKK